MTRIGVILKLESMAHATPAGALISIKDDDYCVLVGMDTSIVSSINMYRRQREWVITKCAQVRDEMIRNVIGNLTT